MAETTVFLALTGVVVGGLVCSVVYHVSRALYNDVKHTSLVVRRKEKAPPRGREEKPVKKVLDGTVEDADDSWSDESFEEELDEEGEEFWLMQFERALTEVMRERVEGHRQDGEPFVIQGQREAEAEAEGGWRVGARAPLVPLVRPSGDGNRRERAGVMTSPKEADKVPRAMSGRRAGSPVRLALEKGRAAELVGRGVFGGVLAGVALDASPGGSGGPIEFEKDAGELLSRAVREIGREKLEKHKAMRLMQGVLETERDKTSTLLRQLTDMRGELRAKEERELELEKEHVKLNEQLDALRASTLSVDEVVEQDVKRLYSMFAGMGLVRSTMQRALLSRGRVEPPWAQWEPPWEGISTPGRAQPNLKSGAEREEAGERDLEAPPWNEDAPPWRATGRTEGYGLPTGVEEEDEEGDIDTEPESPLRETKPMWKGSDSEEDHLSSSAMEPGDVKMGEVPFRRIIRPDLLTLEPAAESSSSNGDEDEQDLEDPVPALILPREQEQNTEARRYPESESDQASESSDSVTDEPPLRRRAPLRWLQWLTTSMSPRGSGKEGSNDSSLAADALVSSPSPTDDHVHGIRRMLSHNPKDDTIPSSSSTGSTPPHNSGGMLYLSSSSSSSSDAEGPTTLVRKRVPMRELRRLATPDAKEDSGEHESVAVESSSTLSLSSSSSDSDEAIEVRGKGPQTARVTIPARRTPLREWRTDAEDVSPTARPAVSPASVSSSSSSEADATTLSGKRVPLRDLIGLALHPHAKEDSEQQTVHNLDSSSYASSGSESDVGMKVGVETATASFPLQRAQLRDLTAASKGSALPSSSSTSSSSSWEDFRTPSKTRAPP